jgi:erythromycin esterase
MARRRRTIFHDPEADEELIVAVRSAATPLRGWRDLDPLIDRIGDARFVLLGEASHGTAEYYDWRRLISQRLIREKGFTFIAVEGDWPDCYRVNRYVKGYADSGSSEHAVLGAFQRWPTWMWANEEVARLVAWLRDYNRDQPEAREVGFYGLDVYSLWDSMHVVLKYLEEHDGDSAAAARRAFECFEPFDYDVDQYARLTAWAPRTCEDAIVKMLAEVRRRGERFEQDGEAYFNAEQNALVAQNAETYYRTMVGGDAQSWNIRDRHMVETLNRLVEHHGRDAKAIVWEHNTHVGDARHTDMADDGMLNVGQLVREQHADEGVVLVGFSSHRGSVVAGDRWGAAMRRVPVPIGRKGSWEDVLHQALSGDGLLVFDQTREPRELLEPRGHRAIGVVYRPEYEGLGNYVPTVLPRRYDALAFIDESHALHPLRVPASFEHEVPETYPTGV